MSRNTMRRFCLPVAAAIAVAYSSVEVAKATTVTGSGINLTFDNASNAGGTVWDGTTPEPGTHLFTNPAGQTVAGSNNPSKSPPVDTNSFATDITIDPASTLTVIGSVHFDLHGSANLGVSGATFSQGADIIINQTTPLSSNTAHITASPTGTAQLTLWDQQTGGNNPGGDNQNTKATAKLPSTLNGADLTAFNVALLGSSGGASVNSNPITLNGSGQLNNFLGLFDVPLTVAINGNASVGLSKLNYVQTSGDMLVGDGSPSVKGFPVGNDATRTSGFPLTDTLGVLQGTGNAAVGGALTLSVLGINIVNNQSLGNLVNQSFDVNTDFPLPGQVTLQDLNPGGYNIPKHDDLQFTAGVDLTGLGIPFALASSGTALLVTTTTITTNLVAPVTITVNVTGTITFGIMTSLSVDNLTYQLQDSVASVVAPEPGSIVLIFLGVVASVPMLLRRRRNRKS